MEEIKCVDEDGDRISGKELYDLSVKTNKDLLKQAKNTHGLTGEDARTLVKFKLFLNLLQRNCEMFLWDGSHFGKEARHQAYYDRKNGRTPDITYKPFSMDLKFVLVHPFFTLRRSSKALSKTRSRTPNGGHAPIYGTPRSKRGAEGCQLERAMRLCLEWSVG